MLYLQLKLGFVWHDDKRSIPTYSLDLEKLQSHTLGDVKSLLVDLVRKETLLPVHESYVTFWKSSGRHTHHFTSDQAMIHVDESTRFGDFFHGSNPLCIKSSLGRKRSLNYAEREAMVKKISDVYTLLLDTVPPLCAGACPVSADKCMLYYRSTDGLRDINLSNATEEELKHLTEACKPAPFGRNDQDVYDESYRKAWKMDTGDFITHFNVDDTDIISTIKYKLVQFGNKYNREVDAELYKLNVYGKGSFFKSHKDTPRSDRMFGSLVVVFPTAHEGGVFTLRHHDQEWETDFATMISEAQQTPAVGFVAFFSDIDHEVKEVTSGYRVTLTYNLSFAPSSQPTNAQSSIIKEIQPFSEKVAKLAREIDEISSLDTFQYGGYLAFGLLYQYPVSERGSVASLRTCLKGQDVALASILDDLGHLGLKWDLRIFYRSQVHEGRTNNFLSKHVLQFGPYANISDFDGLLPDAEYVTIIGDSPFEGISSEESPDSDYQGRYLVPLTPIPRFPRRPSKFIEYGNEASAGKLYSDICLIVEIPAEIAGSERPPRNAVLEARKEHLEDVSDDSQGESEE